jgi:hypothetical protein
VSASQALARSAAAVADRALWHAVLTLLLERLPILTTEELMVFAGIPTDQRLHTRAAQDFLDRGPDDLSGWLSAHVG